MTIWKITIKYAIKKILKMSLQQYSKKTLSGLTLNEPFSYSQNKHIYNETLIFHIRMPPEEQNGIRNIVSMILE
ncbi:protein of unknown function [Citrobacter amalonaticus]|uniref:Uncharacterized protein n=1 Tax=Citrobacter amalonaticus TaxID=35703 RepID=A0AAX2BCR2_CITAM|nr:protein of unknown function [Citrobacter amalonaticus]